MENNKLKKLGKYFTKGLLTGVLATALMAGTAGCIQPAGGNGTEFNGGNGGEQTETGWTKPSYMNISAEFEGQQFLKLDNGVRWANDQNRDTNFDTSYKNAQDFLKNKLAELQKTVNTSKTGSLTNEINTLLNNYNTGTNISATIDNNFTALAPVMSKMENTLLNNNEDDFNKYRVSYYKLAHNAYQNSLGSLSKNTTFRVNQQMLSDIYPNNYFAGELSDTNLSYSELDVVKARTLMNDNLSKISNKTGTDLAVLKKVINLALYNESLYGLNDYAKTEKVSSYNKKLRYEHSITDMGDYIYAYESKMTRNIDNGLTM